MTAVLDPAPVASSGAAAQFDSGAIPVGWLGQPQLLRGIDRRDLTDYRQHLAEHEAFGSPSTAQLLDLLDQVSLVGRGGAAFPLARKLRSLSNPQGGRRPVVVVNGCEGEPSSAKDLLLLGSVPHLVLDGAAIVAEAIGADRIVVAVTDVSLRVRLSQALRGRPDAGRFELHTLPDHFVSGEARALVAGLNGEPALPPGRRVIPTVRGVDGRPTLLSNAETYAQLARLVRVGAPAFAAQGTANEPGTTLLTVTGAVARPAVLEVPHGISVGAVAEVVGAARSQAVVVGGFHGAWLDADPALVLGRVELAAAGGTLGAGALTFLGEHTCGLAELTRVAQWLAGQSARQCGPCAFGLPALVDDLTALTAGRTDATLATRHASLVRGRGACAHPDGASRFVLSGLRVLADEVARHRQLGGCGRVDAGDLPLSRAAAFRIAAGRKGR
ncbi:proton-conducting membrane transporter [Jatrophihabitans telluris]|uniref:Proton-conducting membrane transporter n=1 Tax=Jatrophihabitans telluris TaxID=2038343 RepID=A0ABY4QYP6_9ACTN|nr:NADH-ubiquinone oxidoreductase-F iron-sulfur binding region domain-containing protein [Jatrophihabitans telluris]UQX88312.1 proton-conducting membrane transporter [Jatrophihabitans telluris]